MYAAKYASTANSWKYYIGQTRGLKRLDVEGKKAATEAGFTKWLTSNSAANEKYGKSLPMLQDFYSSTNETQKAFLYARLTGMGGAEFMGLASEFQRTFEKYFAETDATKKQAMLDGFKASAEAFFVEYNTQTDKDVFVALTNLYRNRIAANARPSWHAVLDAKYKGNVQAYADKLFATSVIVDKTKLMNFLAKPNQKVFEKDLAVATAKSAGEFGDALGKLIPREKMSKGQREFVAGLREMNPTKQYAPDANSTMRITYGQVKDYTAADAVHYDFYTTAKGIMEKRDNSNPEFVVPEALAQKIQNKQFGRYANEKGELPTCFIADLDITGGNSGSPVLDANGQMIGIAFDGNWEAMSGDIAYEPELQRTIAVDIRYVLFIVEELMGGKNIVDEMLFVRGRN